ncbi:MAG: M23 family metallopeptidase [Pseudolabrys sp.]|nr:M23 family metallopeptidase [Pseudolabrys sp.]
MSHSIASFQPSAGHGPRRAPVHPHAAAAVSRKIQRTHEGYVLVHRGHQVRIGPVVFWIVVGTLVIMALWSIATGTYFAFHDDVLTRLIARQAEMQTAYEDRIAELRAQVDRITSRQLLDQEQFEQKLNALLQRQTMLESRTNALGNTLMTTGSLHRPRDSEAETTKSARPSPISDTVIFRAPPDREARLISREAPPRPARLAARGDGKGLDGLLQRVSRALDEVERKQTLLVTDLEQRFDSKARRMRSVLDELGVDPKSQVKRAIGGPFVPIKPPRADAGTFERQLYRINLAQAQIDTYTRALATVPIRKPVEGAVDMSSPFGVRTDPFLGRPAMHTGIDLRGDYGEPVRATAEGRVTVAGWDGGYGNMVEIDHGNGLATRYGHLSEIDVKVGQRIRIGQVIGKIGSTGRSTGPHLHYETRVRDEPVDPQKYLRAGIRLGAM